MCGNELMMGQRSRSSRRAGIGLLDEARSPRFGRPSGVDFPLRKSVSWSGLAIGMTRTSPPLSRVFQAVHL